MSPLPGTFQGKKRVEESDRDREGRDTEGTTGKEGEEPALVAALSLAWMTPCQAGNMTQRRFS